MRMVSDTLSPLDAEEDAASEKPSAQPDHGGFKAQTGPGAGLIKAGSQYFSVAGVGIFCRIVFDIVCQVKKPVKLLRGKIQRTHQMSHGIPHFCTAFVLTFSAKRCGKQKEARKKSKSRLFDF